MKEYLIFAIYLYISKHKKTTAKELGDMFEISTRSVYRYIDALSLCGVPVITKIGRGGGIELVGKIKLEWLVLSDDEKNKLIKYIKNIDDKDIVRILEKIIY